jgi:hypothetical protein
MKTLRAECLRVMCSNITLDSATAYALLANEHSCPELFDACVGYAAASGERLNQLLATPGYLHLIEAMPRVGQAFVRATMQQLLASN